MQLTQRSFFLLDCLGAVLSAVLLGVVLVRFQVYIGMPVPVLYALSSVACGFAVYSGSCYLLRVSNTFFLRIIAVANGTYCAVTIALLFHFYDSLTALGTVYFTAEIFVIGFIGMREWRYSQPVGH